MKREDRALWKAVSAIMKFASAGAMRAAAESKGIERKAWEHAAEQTHEQADNIEREVRRQGAKEN